MNAPSMDARIWANLLWKEWREHQWKLVALVAITLGTYLGLGAAGYPQNGFAMAFLVLGLTTPLAALFISMGLGAGEQAAGTDNLLRALPATPRRAAIAKLLVGLVAVLAPGLLLILLASCLHAGDALFEWPVDVSPRRVSGFFGTGVWQIEAVLYFTLVGASLLVWCAVLGMNHTSELRAGAVTLVGIVALWLIAPPGDDTASVALPGGVIRMLSAPAAYRRADSLETTDRAIVMGIYLTIHGLLVWRWVAGYATTVRATKPDSHAERVNQKAWLGAPCPSVLRAILWKQFRECLPLAGGVAALGVGWALWMMQNGEPPPNGSSVWGAIWLTAMSGFLAALMVGVGGFQDDLKTGLSAFWRSRPIDPNRWFWIKYAGGLVTLATVFGGAYLLALLMDAEETLEFSSHPMRFLAAFWLTYAVAVLASCTIRNVIYAGILAFVAVGVVVGAAFSRYGHDLLPAAAQLAILGFAAASVTLLAWQAMRRDWRLGA